MRFRQFAKRFDYHYYYYSKQRAPCILTPHETKDVHRTAMGEGENREREKNNNNL